MFIETIKNIIIGFFTADFLIITFNYFKFFKYLIKNPELRAVVTKHNLIPMITSQVISLAFIVSVILYISDVITVNIVLMILAGILLYYISARFTKLFENKMYKLHIFIVAIITILLII